MDESSGAKQGSMITLLMFLTGAAALGWTVLWLYAYPNYQGTAEAREQRQIVKSLEKVTGDLDRIHKRESEKLYQEMRQIKRENKKLKEEKMELRRESQQ